MLDRETKMQILRHASGRGLAPVPHEGAGFFDRVKGFGKQAYSIFAPMFAKAGKTLAKDIISDLNRRVVEI